MFTDGDCMDKDEKMQTAINMLKDKAKELDRLPKRSDFDSKTVCFIKQKLGAWPRAIETAGLKEPTKISGKEKSRLKRERRKKAIKAAKRNELSEKSEN